MERPDPTRQRVDLSTDPRDPEVRLPLCTGLFFAATSLARVGPWALRHSLAGLVSAGL